MNNNYDWNELTAPKRLVLKIAGVACSDLIHSNLRVVIRKNGLLIGNKILFSSNSNTQMLHDNLDASEIVIATPVHFIT
jgi:hypothetical protein